MDHFHFPNLRIHHFIILFIFSNNTINRSSCVVVVCMGEQAEKKPKETGLQYSID